MNIYELDAKLDYGPLRADGRYIESSRVGTVAETYTTGDDTCLLEAKMIEHCRNNFMRALEALKEEHKITVAYESDKMSAVPHCPELCDVCELIAELEAAYVADIQKGDR